MWLKLRYKSLRKQAPTGKHWINRGAAYIYIYMDRDITLLDSASTDMYGSQHGLLEIDAFSKEHTMITKCLMMS